MIEFLSNISNRVMQIHWHPVLPIGYIIFAVVCAAALSILQIVQLRSNAHTTHSGAKHSITILFAINMFRLIAIATIAIILAGPSKSHNKGVRSTPDKQEDTLYILSDISESMCVADVINPDTGNFRTRFDSMQNSLATLRSILEDQQTHIIPNFYTLGSTVQYVTPEALFNSISPTNRSSRLTEQLESLLLTFSTQEHTLDSNTNILLLTDGRDSTGRSLSSLRSLAESTQIPIYAIPIGTTMQQPDAVVYVSADHTKVMPNQETTLRVEINHVGLHNQTAQCIIRENGIIIIDEAILLSDANIRLEYPIFPEPDPAIQSPTDQNAPNLQGIASYEVTIEPVEGEYLTTNNTKHAFVQIVDERIRVVLFENEPYWDTRFLIQALREDARIDLTTITGFGRIQRAIRYHAYSDYTAPAEEISRINTGKGWSAPQDNNTISTEPYEHFVPNPITQDWLNQFDVVILGKGIERWFPTVDRMQYLTTYVRDQGGSLVMARGMPIRKSNNSSQLLSDAIDAISPVKWGVAELSAATQLERPEIASGTDPGDLSAFGDTNEVLTRLPGMIARTKILEEKTLSTIWLQHENIDTQIAVPLKHSNTDHSDYAAVVHQRFGNGQVLAILSHGLWKWAFMQPGDNDDMSSVYHIFWTRAIRMLASAGELLPGQSIGLSLDSMSTSLGEDINILVQTRYIQNETFQPQLSITDPDSTTHKIPLYRTSDRSTRYTATFNATIEGVHRVTLDCDNYQPKTLTSLFAAYDRNTELLDTSADHISLQRLCDATGGQMIPVTNPSLLFDHIEQTKIAEDVIDTAELEYLFANPYVWTILILCFGIEWVLRRRNGLV